MVKADPKRDYYADLDLPCTADQDSIKRKFRDLAKQFHPDRNPGHEVDVVPKFQAVQTAHEILSDPVQKARYDADRAKLNKPNPPTLDTPAFKKPAPPTRVNSNYSNGSFPQSPPANPPGPRRDPSATRSFQPQNGTRRPNSSSSGTAERFAQFARAAGNQQWDRARFDAAAAADGLRGMNAMRAGPQTGSQTRRAPTAPRNMADAAPHSAGPGPSPGFPGLGRTPSGRRGFNPAAAGGDEPPSSAGSAYSHTHRSERPPSTGSFGLNPQAQQKPRNAVSPLRQSRSAHFPDIVYAVRPGLQRDSSRYAQQSGERTFVNTSNISRSTSVRNSPIDPRWEDETDFKSAQSPADARAARPRRRSLSPPKSGRTKFEFPASSTSSDDDSTPPSQRPKATPREPRARPGSSTRMFSDEDPALTGHFPGTNYTRLVDESQYHYPPPQSKAPSRKPFPSMPSPLEEPAHHSADQTPDDDSPDQPPSTFDSSRWHDEFGKSEENIFRPSESTPRDRRSPNRNARNLRPTMRKQQNNQDENPEPTSSKEESTFDDVKHVSTDETQTKAAAFQAGKLNPDWADQFRAPTSQRRASDSGPSTSERPITTEADNNDAQTTSVNGDEMDVDEPQFKDNEPSSATASESSYKVTVEEEESPPPIKRGHRRSSTSHSVNGGVHIGGLDDMDDFARQAPFTPSEGGLDGMGDLHTNLPFPSQASRDPLGRNNSHLFRHLAIPRPPEPPNEPKELSQSSWKAYADAMTEYMHGWTKFNSQMLAHFQARQEQMTHGMYRNWISAQGDGASADSFEHNFGSGHPGERAGYQTYMTWLEDDRKCRAWWEVACDEHMKCMKKLGEVRTRVKARAHVDC